MSRGELVVHTSPGRRAALGAVIAIACGAPLVIASCADSTSGDSLPFDAGAPTVDQGTPDGADSGALEDGGCEAGDPRCAPTSVSCEETDFCPVNGAVDPRVALTSIWGSGKDDVWAAGSLGMVVHWDGAAWKPYPITTTYTLFGLWGSGRDDLWAASAVDATFHGTRNVDGSVSWSKLPPLPAPISNDLFPAVAAVWGMSNDDVWIGGGDKMGFPFPRVWRAKPDGDGGITWTTLAPCASTPTDCPGLRAIWARGPEEIWLVGDRGRTYRGAIMEDADVPFVLTESQTNASLRAVWGPSEGPVWAVGDDGVIRTISSNDSAWTIVPSPTTFALRGIWGSSATDVWAVGAYGTILHFDGKSWTAASAAFAAGPKPTLYGVWGSDAGDVWIVGEGIVLRRSSAGGTNP